MTGYQNGVSPMTPKYHISLFWSETDSPWVAELPELRSCSAFGDSPGEALAVVEKRWRLGWQLRGMKGCRSRNGAMMRQNAPPLGESGWRIGTINYGEPVMNGAESLVRTLVGGGVNVCFANPGTSEMHFVAALDRVVSHGRG